MSLITIKCRVLVKFAWFLIGLIFFEDCHFSFPSSFPPHGFGNGAHFIHLLCREGCRSAEGRPLLFSKTRDRSVERVKCCQENNYQPKNETIVTYQIQLPVNSFITQLSKARLN